MEVGLRWAQARMLILGRGREEGPQCMSVESMHLLSHSIRRLGGFGKVFSLRWGID